MNSRRKLTSLVLRSGAVLALAAALVTLSSAPAWAQSLIQEAPFANAGEVTPATSASFIDQLAVTPNDGSVTFTTSSVTPPAGASNTIQVSSGGAVSATGELIAGQYVAVGTDGDDMSDSGGWIYTLTVTPGTLTQTSPTGNGSPVTPVDTTDFSEQLTVSGTQGTASFSQSDTTGPVGATTFLAADTSGHITTTGELIAGTYQVTGTDSDSYGDTGTFTYTLTVSAGSLAQSSPTSNATTVTPAESAAFTNDVTLTGTQGTPSFTEVSSTGPVGATTFLEADTSGHIAATGELIAGTYQITGSDSDSYRDTGTWTYTLTVSPGALLQSSPTSNGSAVTPLGSDSFGEQLTVTGTQGAQASFTADLADSSPLLQVSTSGAITPTTELPVGSYTIEGSDTDPYGDVGTWTYTVTVTPAGITQVPPTYYTQTLTPYGESQHAYSDQLEPTSDQGAVTYSSPTTTSPTGVTTALQVSSSGLLSLSGVPTVGIYTATGVDSDTFGDTGSWSYSLTVSPGAVTQTTPTSNTATVTPLDSATFTDSIGVSGTVGSPVFSESAGSSVPVDSTGKVAPGQALAVGAYTASGDSSDQYGDTGTWSYTLDVTPATIVQAAPFSNTASVTPATSKSFTDDLAVAASAGTLSYKQTGGSPSISVAADGAVTVPSSLAAGKYTASGTDTDSDGDTGSWTFTLTVKPVTVSQAAPSSNATTPAGSGKFSQQLAVSGAIGAVKFTTSSVSAPSGAKTTIKVSGSGLVTTSGTLAVGTYAASGTDSDAYGDTGTWSYSLKVSPTAITQSKPFKNSGVVTTAGSAKFVTQLKATGAYGAVSFVTTSKKEPEGATTTIRVSSTGAVSTTGALRAGTYTASGSDFDVHKDTGTWSFSLTVTALKLSQLSPTAATTPTGKKYSAQLAVAGTTGAVSYRQLSGAPELSVGATGALSAAGTLKAGTYKASGTDGDSLGDAGTWSYTLTVTPTAITQPAAQSASIRQGQGFSAQLVVSGAHGAVTFTESKGAPELTVSFSGKISAVGRLAKGTYRASGSDSDALGDTGTWAFTLTVTGQLLTQLRPGAAATTTGRAFSTRLRVSGAHGAVTFAETKGAPYLRVSSSGVVSASDNLRVGTYRAEGTTRDVQDDTGTWVFVLTVSGTRISQLAPFAASTSAHGSFTARLKVSGAHGTVSFSPSAASGALRVSAGGVVSSASSLRPGRYRVSGRDVDSLGDTGTWTFTLTVTGHALGQVGPASATVGTGQAFRGQLKASGAVGAVTYAKTAGAPAIKVSASGAITAPPSLTSGRYRISGRDVDSLGDKGTWTFTLSVTAHALGQVGPAAASGTAGQAFSGQLAVSGAVGTVTYTQTAGAPAVKVSASGAIAAPPSLTPGTYSASGRVVDSVGDSGTWSYRLTVLPGKLAQVGHASATVKSGTAFKGQLKVSGAKGKVTWTQQSGAPKIKVSSSGVISAPKTLAKGTYKASGSDRDAAGDTGSWSFTLTVKAAATTPPRNGKLVQIAPTAGRVVSGKTFTAQLRVSGAHGALDFTQLTGAEAMTVSSSGLVTARSTLAPATYVITGTVKDTSADTGTWTFTLFVAPV